MNFEGLVVANASLSCITCLIAERVADVKIAVGEDITIEFYVDGVLQSSATAANTGRGLARAIRNAPR